MSGEKYHDNNQKDKTREQNLGNKQPQLVNKRKNMNFNCLNIGKREESFYITNINLLIYNIIIIEQYYYLLLFTFNAKRTYKA